MPRWAVAIGPSSKVRLAHLALAGGGGKTPRAKGLAALGGEIRRRTNISVHRGVQRVSVSSPALFRLPLLVTTADGDLPKLTGAEVVRLRRHLARGGTWIIDGPTSTGASARFRASAKRVAGQLYPKLKLAPLPLTHTLFKSFYLLRPSWYKRQSQPISAVVRDGRATVIVVAGLSAAGGGGSGGRAGGGGAFGGGTVHGRVREWLYRLAVNLVMYALCVDYKSDQVHAPAILRRRRWRVP
jgi:Domain of unknown function (DUF4159)